MQDHRKSQETVFWADLARLLCELRLTTDFDHWRQTEREHF